MSVPRSDAPGDEGDEDLEAQVAQRVAAAEASGIYPPGVDEDLASHLQRVVEQRRGGSPLVELADAVEKVRQVSSGAGAASDREAGRAPRRYRDALGRALAPSGDGDGEFAAAVVDAFDVLVRGLDPTAPSHVHPELHGLLDSLVDRLTTIEREMRGEASPGPAARAVDDRSPRLVIGHADDTALSLAGAVPDGTLGALAVDAMALDQVPTWAPVARRVLAAGGLLAVGDATDGHVALVSEGFSDVSIESRVDGTVLRATRLESDP